MKKIIATALLLAAACSKQAALPANEAEPAANATTPVENEAPLNPPAPGEPGGLPDDRTPISEGAIDPKSGQGAGQVLQSYFALSESGRFAEANKLWSVGVERLDLTGYREVHANIGAPGKVEGGAGSLYVEVPVQLYGRLKDGKEFSSRGTMTLRRVNDVPGSTEEQRRWHIMNAEFVNAD
jgi:hypothetical protein